MTYELTDIEKADVIRQHLRQLAFSRYGLYLSRLEAAATLSTEELAQTDYDSRIAAIDNQISALNAELALLNLE